MLPFEEALKTVLNSVHSLGSERVDLSLALSRILAEDAKSDMEKGGFG
jgi:molybdopterin biosynthesis enzyme